MLLDVDAGAQAQVMRWIAVSNLDKAGVTYGSTYIGVLAGHGHPAGLVYPDLGNIENAVPIIARDVDRGHTGLVVGNVDTGKGHIAGVRDIVGPVNSATHRNSRPGWKIGILPVGVLLDVNGGA